MCTSRLSIENEAGIFHERNSYKIEFLNTKKNCQNNEMNKLNVPHIIKIIIARVPIYGDLKLANQ